MMRVMKDLIRLYFNDPEVHIIQSKYEDIKDSDLVSGFYSETIDGKDVHKISEDIVISVQNFSDGILTNLIFSNGKVAKLQLLDNEIYPYYSDYIELRYIIEGFLYLDIEGQSVRFDEGDVCFIHSKALHHELLNESQCTIINISIGRQFFNELFLSDVSLSPFQNFLRTNILKLGQKENYIQFMSQNKLNEEIEFYIRTIFTENLSRRAGYNDIIKGYLLRLMNCLSSAYTYSLSESESKQYYDDLFEEISAYMQNHLANVTMNDLADEFHFHPNYFNNLIKKKAGMTYSAYLIQMRINRAKKLLETTDFSVEEIAWLVGYQNKGFFYKRFVEDVGVSPRSYRINLLKKKQVSSKDKK